MKVPFLIAGSPRAGNQGRILVPSGGFTEGVIRKFMDAGVTELMGGNFIAYSAKVEQRLENGTIRTGTEALVLVGVDVRQLTLPQLASCLRCLRKRLELIEPALAREKPWESAPDALFASWLRLDSWLHEDGLDALPTTAIEIGPEYWAAGAADSSARLGESLIHASPHGRRATSRLLLTIVVVLVIAVTGAGLWRLWRNSEHPPPDGEKSGSSAQALGARKEKFENLSKAYGVGSEVLTTELWHALGRESKSSPNPGNLDALLSYPNIQSLLDREPSDQETFFHFIPKQDKQTLVEYVGESPTAASALQARRTLSKTAGYLAALRRTRLAVDEAWVNHLVVKENTARFYPFLWILRLAGSDSIAGQCTSQATDEPFTPILTLRDAQVASAVNELFRIVQDGSISVQFEVGILPIFKASTAHQRRNELRKRKKELAKVVQQEQFTVMGALERKVNEKIRQQIHSAYEDLKSIFLELANDRL